MTSMNKIGVHRVVTPIIAAVRVRCAADKRDDGGFHSLKDRGGNGGAVKRSRDRHVGGGHVHLRRRDVHLRRQVDRHGRRGRESGIVGASAQRDARRRGPDASHRADRTQRIVPSGERLGIDVERTLLAEVDAPALQECVSRLAEFVLGN